MGVVSAASEYQVIVPTGVLVTVRVLSPPKHIVLFGTVGAGGAATISMSTDV